MELFLFDLFPRSGTQILLCLKRLSFYTGCLILFCSLPIDSMSQQSFQLSLSGQWEFRQADRGEWMPATVPGCVHTDLMELGLLPDPFYRLQEMDAQWVDKVDWEYRKTIHLTSVYQEMDVVELRFEGLDTRADVYWDGQLLAQTNNAFRHWILPLDPQLRTAGTHTIRIYFYSPIAHGLLLQQTYGTVLPAINDQSKRGGVPHNRKVSPYLRKPPFHFGWDWGPRLVSSGISHQVSLNAWNQLSISDVYIHQREVSGEQASLESQCTVRASSEGAGMLRIRLNGLPLLEQAVSWKKGESVLTVPFIIEHPRLWWTHDLGEPYLYHMEVLIQSEAGLLDRATIQTGIRDIRLIREPDSGGRGSSFRFELNGVALFAKGANYIPQDIFLSRVTSDHHRRLIAAASEANMNMIRIWGGGAYEDEAFYRQCDEKGILVWQDFMFACAMYPGNRAFLKNVQAEARDQVTRLRNHPCIALWCGNNEIDLAWAQYNPIGGWGWKQRYRKKTRRKIWKANTDLFHVILPEVVADLHPTVEYWPSSPYEKDGGHSGNKSTEGDMHYWGVWHGKHPFNDFHTYIGRFMSEYGFQSFPEFRTVETYTVPEDHGIESDVMAAHQRSGIGNLRIRSYMEDHYLIPDSFEHFLYVGQLLQAKAIRTAIEAHRFARPYCMGTLYWQLNDCWPVASWSGIDYVYRWKALHFEVRRAFRPFILGVKGTGSDAALYVSSDARTDVAASLRIQTYRMNGAMIQDSSYDVHVPASRGTKLGSLQAFARMTEAEPLMIYMALIAENGEELCYRIWSPEAPKHLELQPPVFQIEQEEVSTGIRYTLSTDVPAMGVWLQSDLEAEFSDNFFHLVPGVPREVYLPAAEEDKRTVNVRIMSLYDTLTNP